MIEKLINNSKALVKNIGKDAFLTEFSFDACMDKYGKLKSAKDAFLIESPTFYSVKLQYGNEFLMNFLLGWIIELNENFNFSRTQNEKQIKKTVMYIIQDFGHFKMSDWFLVITRIEKGVYGPYFESMDVSKLHTFFREYEIERINGIVKIQHEEESKGLNLKDQADFYYRNAEKIPSLKKLLNKYKRPKK